MPRELDDNIEDLEPSTSPDLDETTAAATADQQTDDAASSPATGETEDNLLSVVRDVVSESRGQADAASPAEGAESEGTEQQEQKKQDDEDYSDVPFHKHPRFQQLLRKSKAFEQDAVRYQNVVGFLDQAGLTDAEAADGLTIMGLAKTDPAEAWNQIKPWVQNLLRAAGEVLPDDLQQRVQSGEMSREAAQELSRATARAQSMQAAQSFREQQAQQRQQTEAVNSLRNTAQSWVQDRFTKDPNFATKETAVMKEVLFLQQTDGKPNTPEGVKAQLDKAYRAVNAALKPAPVAPQRQAIRPVTGGKVAGNQQPAATTTLDIIRANRRSG
jgi:hypothetical protein